MDLLFCAEALARDGEAEGDAGAASTSSVYVDIVGRDTSPDTDMPDQLPGASPQQQIVATMLCNPVPKCRKASSTCQRLLSCCLGPHLCTLPTATASSIAVASLFSVPSFSRCHLPCIICMLHHVLIFAAAADWDHTLSELWQNLQQKTANLTCKEVQDNSEEPTAPSCTITVCGCLLISVTPTLSANLMPTLSANLF